MVDEFLKKYDDGSMTFNSVSFREGAAFTLPFGIYSAAAGDFEKWGLKFSDGRRLYFHFGVDRGRGRVVCPFDSYVRHEKNVPGYGTMTTLYPDGADFEIRIAHMEEFSSIANKAMKAFNILQAGEPLGIAGNAGLSMGAHTHTEIVSVGPSSRVIEAIMEEKGISQRPDIRADLYDKIPYKDQQAAEEYTRPRGVVYWSENKVIRLDSYKTDAGHVTYYDSRAIFGM